MFILQSKDVKPISVVKKGVKNPKVIRALHYRGHLFIPIASYKKNEADTAIKECRKFLEKEIPITAIIVKTSQSFTLWVHDERLEMTTTAQNKKLVA